MEENDRLYVLQTNDQNSMIIGKYGSLYYGEVDMALDIVTSGTN